MKTIIFLISYFDCFSMETIPEPVRTTTDLSLIGMTISRLFSFVQLIFLIFSYKFICAMCHLSFYPIKKRLLGSKR